MIWRDYLSWWLRPLFLRSWGTPSHTLFAGPWVGEFGWELFHWQGFVRKLSKRYERVVVSCRKGNEALYEDFAHDFVFHDIRGVADCNRLKSIENPQEITRIKGQIPPGADVLAPLGMQPSSRQEYICFGKHREDLRSDIVFHPRGRGHGADRNWDEKSWNDLIKRLNDQGMSLVCIGLRQATIDVHGDFRDLRDIPLSETMDVLSSTKLVIGPSSGPMHLASLCGACHLVWTDRKRWAHGLRNRDKYERLWNPFGTEVVVIDHMGFSPSVETITQSIQSYFEK